MTYRLDQHRRTILSDSPPCSSSQDFSLFAKAPQIHHPGCIQPPAGGPVKSRTTALALSTGVVAALLAAAPAAQAAPVAKPDPAALSTTFAQQLGTRSAGSYLDN